MTSAILMEKARELAVEMNDSFVPSSGCLWRWQKREGIAVKKLHGEGESGDIEACQCFKSIVKEKIYNFNLVDVFNADETGLFY